MAIFDANIFDADIFDVGVVVDALFDPNIFDSCIFDTGQPCPSPGGASTFGLRRGMLVVDQEAWEEDGIILPLMLDDFP